MDSGGFSEGRAPLGPGQNLHDVSPRHADMYVAKAVSLSTGTWFMGTWLLTLWQLEKQYPPMNHRAHMNIFGSFSGVSSQTTRPVSFPAKWVAQTSPARSLNCSGCEGLSTLERDFFDSLLSLLVSSLFLFFVPFALSPSDAPAQLGTTMMRAMGLME